MPLSPLEVALFLIISIPSSGVCAIYAESIGKLCSTRVAQ